MNGPHGVASLITTAYDGDHYEVEGTKVRKYYAAGGQRVAMRENGTLFFLLSDNLGSTAVTTDKDGAKVGELRYKAFGETRYAVGELATTYRYTGQRAEDALGLDYYRARWYDPHLGRWIQPDTFVPGSGTPLALDRFAYVLGNPLRYADPSGRFPYC